MWKVRLAIQSHGILAFEFVIGDLDVFDPCGDLVPSSVAIRLESEKRRTSVLYDYMVYTHIHKRSSSDSPSVDYKGVLSFIHSSRYLSDIIPANLCLDAASCRLPCRQGRQQEGHSFRNLLPFNIYRSPVLFHRLRSILHSHGVGSNWRRLSSYCSHGIDLKSL